VTSEAAAPVRAGSLARRFLIYQRERFPLAAYAPLVAVFTFSSAAYSRLLREAATPGYPRSGWIAALPVPAERLAVGAGTSLVCFFLLRVLDEHKDAAHDRRSRPELPVPRGLITLAELRRVAGVGLAVALALNALLAPALLWAILTVALWMALMTKEFFVGSWLRRHPTAYLISHMAIMPMIDSYTTGLDWLAEGAGPPRALWLFLVVTYLNGSVLEIGRKLRAPGEERPGVTTYTAAWGVRGAPLVWLAILTASAVTAWRAALPIGAGRATALLLMLCGTAAAVPALQFLRTPRPGAARQVETASGLWTLALYLFLGAGPLVVRWWK
jgi:hypothetical protein